MHIALISQSALAVRTNGGVKVILDLKSGQNQCTA